MAFYSEYPAVMALQRLVIAVIGEPARHAPGPFLARIPAVPSNREHGEDTA
jgi:hypothetical protein